ncbi:MAG: ATP-binding protein [Methanobacteriaceae archaeon]|nr:ATP-binding protein [Methanobacteriaceae archaeon]
MIEREEYMDKIRPFMNTDIIKVITGIRRSGKSTILKFIIDELKKEGVNESNIIYINFESMKYNEIEEKQELDELIIEKTKDLEGKIYLLFDEIQNINSWEKCVNSYLVDFDSDIYITGSNAKLLSGELATYISGRYVEIKIYPFSFKEVLKIKEKRNNLNLNPKNKKEELLLKLEEKETFEEYIEYGGMPPIFKIEDKESRKEYLKNILSTIIIQDIMKRNNVRNVDLLERILKYICENIGNPFSAKSVCDYFKHENRKVYPESVSNYLSYFKDANLIHEVKREDLKGKKILSIYEKYYLVDHGFREVIFGDNLKSKSKILENIVYMELLRRDYNVRIGKLNGYEIDFVATKGLNKIYIQVACTLVNDKTKIREFRPLLKIKNNYPKYIISTDEEDFSKEGIIHKNIIDFLKEDDI